MQSIFTYILSFLAGLVLGLFYFLGLWYTIRQLPGSKTPYIMFFGSLTLRMLVVLGGFYLLARIDWSMIIPAMVAFIVARMLLIRKLRFKGPKQEVKEGAIRNGH